MLRWVRRERQIVGGPALYRGGGLGKRMIVLAVEFAAVRADADVGFRKLHRAAFAAFAADETGQHFAFAIERGQGGLFVQFAADALVLNDQAIEGSSATPYPT